MDVSLRAGEPFEQIVDGADNTLVYVIEGELLIGDEARELSAKNLGILEQGDHVLVTSKSDNARFILISAKPLHEPVARGGPFVMNTQDQVRQAFDDFRNNRF